MVQPERVTKGYFIYTGNLHQHKNVALGKLTTPGKHSSRSAVNYDYRFDAGFRWSAVLTCTLINSTVRDTL